MSFDENWETLKKKLDFLSDRYSPEELREHIKKDNWYKYLYHQPVDNCELLELITIQEWPRFIVEPVYDIFTHGILGYPFIVEYGNYFNHLSVASEWSKYPLLKGEEDYNNITLRQAIVWTNKHHSRLVGDEGVGKATEFIKSGAIRINGIVEKNPYKILTIEMFHKNFEGIIITISKRHHAVIMYNQFP
jgi:hypothetical protein